MVCADLILSVSRVHLASLRTHLVILGPILLRSDPMKVPNGILVVCAEKVQTFFDVIVDMEGVNGESASSN